MILHLNPDQFLTVYRLITSSSSHEVKEIKNKMDSIIHDALSKAEEDWVQNKFPQWLKKEQEKIFMLSNELKSMKESSKICSEKPEPDDGLYYPKPQG